MTKTETISLIQATLPSLPEDRVDIVAAMLKTWSEPSVYERLSQHERDKIEAALDRLDGGQSVSAETVFSDLAAKLQPTV